MIRVAPNTCRRLGAITLAAAVVALVLPATAVGQEPGAGQEMRFGHTAYFAQEDFLFDQARDFDRVALPDGSFLDQVGWPMLPVHTVHIALPQGMAVTGISVVNVQTEPIEGEYYIFPAQPPRHTDDPPAIDDFVAPDAEAYASYDAYPAQPAEFAYQADLAGQGLAVVRFCPLQYVAAERKLVLCRSITVVLEGASGYECGDYLSEFTSKAERENYRRSLERLVVNPNDVQLCPPPGGSQRSRALPSTEFEDVSYVIITQSSWVDDFQPLADWRTKRGLPATIVTTDYIYNQGGYSGSNQDKIRAFVADALAGWGATYFLLGGDTNVIPYHTRSVSGDSIPNDTYYADFDDDWICEMRVGRASVRNTTAIDTFLDKIFTYEQNPPMTDYAKTAFFMGFDLYADGSKEGENLMKFIKNNYIPGDWTYNREYDSESGSHISDCISYLNQGHNLVNHSDHSNYSVMGAGYTNHNDLLGNSDMDNLTNGGRQSILYTLGCWAGAYEYTACIGEHFVQNTNGGGVAFIGNSRYGWYNPYNANTLSSAYDRTFFEIVFAGGQHLLGVCFADHKNEAPTYSSTEYYIFTELTLLGDPGLSVWTDDPQTLTVTHDVEIAAGAGAEFPVYVYSGGNPLQAATVSVWKPGEYYESHFTDASGLAHFSLPPMSTGTVYVSAAGQNCLTYEGQADVIDSITYTLTVDTVGQGMVDLSPAGGVYSAGTAVELTASADTGWCFDQWSGDLNGADNPDSLLMSGDRNVTATFAEDCNSNGVPDYYEQEGNNGLAGAYYDNMDFTGTLRGRVDTTIDFDWGSGAPLPGMDANTFSVRWTGYVITPAVSGTYTFYTTTDDGVRLWVDDQLVVDVWQDQAPAEWSGTITLDASSTYPIVMEYYENGGGAVAELRWEPPGQSKVIIPATSLIPGQDLNNNGVPDDCDPQYTLTVNTVGQGSVTLDPPGGTYLSGLTVELQANGDTGWHFDHWEGALAGSTNPETLLMDDDKSVTAVFVEDVYTYTLTIGSSPITGVTVQVAPLDNFSAGDGVTEFQRVYNADTDVTLTAPARPLVGATELVFCNWKVDQVDQPDNQTVLVQTVTGDVPLTADYLKLGDMNADGLTNGFDIDLFIEALNDAALFEATYGPCRLRAADCTGDGEINGFDIDLFVELIAG